MIDRAYLIMQWPLFLRRVEVSDNVFNENKDYLVDARCEVIKRDSLASDIATHKAALKKLNKNIAAEDKSITDEIGATIKKRKQELSDIYDDRLDDNRSKKKKVLSKRDKKKNQRMNARYEDETKHLRDEQRDIDIEMKMLLRKHRVPGFAGSPLYFVMFMPRGIAEFIYTILSFVIYFAGIPGLITFIIKKAVLDSKSGINMAFWCVLIVALLFTLQLIIYFSILSSTKLRHRDALEQARSLRDKSKANKRQMLAIKNSINKDQDESQYNLDSYDEKLAELDSEADTITKEKQEALRLFEEEKQQAIIDEINGRRLQTLEDMKAEKDALENMIAEEQKSYSDMVLQITNQYGTYIGEDLCKEDKLSDLIALMEDGQATTVSQAISVYKGQKSSR